MTFAISQVDDVSRTNACGNISAIFFTGQSEKMLFPSMHIAA